MMYKAMLSSSNEYGGQNEDDPGSGSGSLLDFSMTSKLQNLKAAR